VSGGAYLYILRCADGSYYVGTARNGLEARVAEHNAGTFDGYTSKRKPVSLIFSQHFESITDAIAAERQVKGWSRAKKEAMMRGDWDGVSALARRSGPHPSRRAASPRSSG
jgi:putative endonuclease